MTYTTNGETGLRSPVALGRFPGPDEPGSSTEGDRCMICAKCKRAVHPWPLQRGDRCSPKSWVYCIRNDGDYGKAA